MNNTIQVALGERSYPIVIGNGLLADINKHIKPKRVLVVTDANVAKLWLPTLLASLEKNGTATAVFTLPAGEATKSFAHLEALMQWLLEQKPDRHTPLIALGGGVVGDITGFAASILLRGVPLIQIPTTLLAMVDSSVGGKTGINTAQGKNLIGSFYQPQQVLMDTATLATLPEREIHAGFAEVIKYGCIADAKFFATLEKHGMRDLPSAIATSCNIKAAIVGQDEREEKDQRALLNFGHSFGHAMEAECGYDGKLLHGEAVAVGMVMAAELSVRLGLCPPKYPARIKALNSANGLPVSPKEIRKHWNVDALLNRMRGDKKNADGKIKLILLKGIGKAVVSTQASEHDLRQLWSDFT
jgi:3-dehydroquinate synthase